jgi:glucosamine--fructose-6-phosphate aminotransferase (isomerizing)
MCGIVGAIAQRQVEPILLEGLRRLEYRGYDSAGMAIINHHGQINRQRAEGKVSELASVLKQDSLIGSLGIAHTRWATHGKPASRNAHPHMSGDEIALVHNGIIENYLEHKQFLQTKGYDFVSDTDTEIVAHLIHYHLQLENDFLKAVQSATAKLHGAFALGIIHKQDPSSLIAVRRGCPLVIGLGIHENFIASDQLALLPVTQRFIFLEEGDVARVSREHIEIYSSYGNAVQRKIHSSEVRLDVVDKGEYRHFMQKEIFEQPYAISQTLEGRLSDTQMLEQVFGLQAAAIFDKVEAVQIVACGTSYHAGLVARYWLEELAGIPTQVEVASELRYRKAAVRPNTLLVAISQSGETADTLAAMRQAKQLGYLGILGICNVPESAVVRESDLVLMTRAGVEIGVASTKAFTTQLVTLLMLVLALGRRHGVAPEIETKLVKALKQLPEYISQTLEIDAQIKLLAMQFADKDNALFLGRGPHYPVALEGALKLKEISYIHAEAYPAGELKHGPLALVDETMPVVVVAPNDDMLEKLKSNLHEVRARGGQLFIFTDAKSDILSEPGITVINVPSVPKVLAPIVYTIPLQLLAYHVALIKGTDVDQPRNLAKSVTVE